MLKKNFSRKDLSEKIYKKIGFSKNFSLNIVDDLFELLIMQLLKFEKMKITSFGTFKVIHKKSRIGRNPKTKIETKISSRKVVTFKPSLLLKERLNR